jgi:nucleotide-binding universal stress UspA family protein
MGTSAHRALDAIVDAILGDDAANVERVCVNDHPARGLLDAASGADLLVLGARGLNPVSELLLGSVSQQCLHHATTPIAIVHGPAVDHAPGIVVGVDASDGARRALGWALDEARRRQAPLTAVHAWMPPYVGGIALPPLAYELTTVEQGKAVLDAVLDCPVVVLPSGD